MSEIRHSRHSELVLNYQYFFLLSKIYCETYYDCDWLATQTESEPSELQQALEKELNVLSQMPAASLLISLRHHKWKEL
ncbi:hypothetical protein PAXINDRAFT_17400 [Paxillus involutus ATCC 200175]|uniref:Uncharacterized protein n=1 Tax=Paxillus involutus ATCC 200175 TaxID=664439 RepID=A0A0C9TEY2_PAXIN|nr:hypothetical protein PAXINDRAFT_17400 [Paxillus involutus ATCC 200175]